MIMIPYGFWVCEICGFNICRKCHSEKMGINSDDKKKTNKKAWKPFAFLNSANKKEPRESIFGYIDQANQVAEDYPLRYKEHVGIEKVYSEAR